jgi:hypothetical protein
MAEDALEVVDRVAARYRPPVEIPRSGSGRRSGLTSDCIELLLVKRIRGVSLFLDRNPYTTGRPSLLGMLMKPMEHAGGAIHVCLERKKESRDVDIQGLGAISLQHESFCSFTLQFLHNLRLTAKFPTATVAIPFNHQPAGSKLAWNGCQSY